MSSGEYLGLAFVAMAIFAIILVRSRRYRRRATRRSSWSENLATRMGGLDALSGAEPLDSDNSQQPPTFLNSNQRKYVEAWHRNSRTVLAFWEREVVVKDAQAYVRRIRLTSATGKKLDELNIRAIVGRTIQTEGQAGDVLGLLEKPTHEMVGFLRFCGQSASRFNQTTANIFYINHQEHDPSVIQRWMERDIDAINYCAMHFFQKDFRALAKNKLVENALKAHVLTLDSPPLLERWREIKELLLSIERGDYEESLVPALNCRFVYRAVHKSWFKDSSQPLDIPALLAQLRGISAEDKFLHSLLGSRGRQQTPSDLGEPSSLLLRSLPSELNATSSSRL